MKQKQSTKINPRDPAIQVRSDDNPSIGRIIICRDWSGDIGAARDVLYSAAESYPRGARTKFLITCGGFITFNLPERFNAMGAEENKDPQSKTMKGLISVAAGAVDNLLTDDLVRALRQHTTYISFGVDSSKSQVSTSQTHISQVHTELVVFMDLATGEYHWTGKSYPTSGQEGSLIRVSDLGSHFLDSDFGEVAILGCHDLNIFNNRGLERAGEWRRGIKSDFKELIREAQPEYVLQHPHVTDTYKIWHNAWCSLERFLPSVNAYAGAGRYFRNGQEREGLPETLEKTKHGETIDFIA